MGNCNSLQLTQDVISILSTADHCTIFSRMSLGQPTSLEIYILLGHLGGS